jgi:poly-gamma-glutamate synthesis protein (capsule biosynthesis protein)
VTAVAVVIVSVAACVGATFAAYRISGDVERETGYVVSIPVETVTADYVKTLPASASRVESVSIMFAGDVMLDRNVATRIRKSGTDAYPFAKVKDDPRFTDADLQVMNLEGPVTTKRAAPDKGEVDFMFDPRFIPVLKDVGFDAVSQANNHTLDQGRVGADDSHSRLLAGGLLVFGDEVLEDAISYTTSTVRGRRIAFVGFNETASHLDEAAASSTLALARTSADTVIAVMHWGAEYQNRPARSVVQRAHWLIDNGADIVVGGHPHWEQGMSVYEGKPILWSLGNFVFDQDWSANTKKGLAVRLLISDKETSIELNPVQIDASQPRFLDGTERDARLRDLASVSDASLTTQILQGRVVVPRND